MTTLSSLEKPVRKDPRSNRLSSRWGCYRQVRRPCPATAFTVIELLAIIAIIAILVAMMLPALAKNGQTTQAFRCMNNTRQLGLAWTMYATDNNDNCPPNLDGGDVQGWQALTANWTRPVPYFPFGGGQGLSWVGGWEDFMPNVTDNTNIYNLTFGAIGAYTGQNTDIYHCPADNYACREGTAMMQRVRSYSMNCFIGDRKNCRATGVNDWYPTYIQYIKKTGLTRPGPAMTCLIVEEHPDSINDGWFITSPADPARLTDLPAGSHNGASGMVYCDGHSELHKWHAATLQPVRMIQYNFFPADPNDVAWLIARTSALR